MIFMQMIKLFPKNVSSTLFPTISETTFDKYGYEIVNSTKPQIEDYLFPLDIDYEWYLISKDAVFNIICNELVTFY